MSSRIFSLNEQNATASRAPSEMPCIETHPESHSNILSYRQCPDAFEETTTEPSEMTCAEDHPRTCDRIPKNVDVNGISWLKQRNKMQKQQEQ